MELSTILSSAVTAGLVAAIVALFTSERKILIENVTQQRQHWREKIRELSLQIQASYQNQDQEALRRHYIEMQLYLNPNDEDDNDILNTIWKMIETKKVENLDIVLGEKLALRLRYDWAEAKKEARYISYLRPKEYRVSYNKFKLKRKANNLPESIFSK
ncbi:hypothetical protein [Halarcobacter anaerophilus]|uniref:hypothetical protein n=1 Tax=Halarcobacter anaerophilus TaxID=877500 RepID=UPI0005CACBAD|nr:hypothetical protein [Halarcobacter anaerophilus]